MFGKHPRKEVCDKEAQTVIRVYPPMLDYLIMARISKERKCQTEISARPDQDNTAFYSMLEYMPFQDIQQSSLRVIDLPRKPRLQFQHSPLARLHLGNCLLLDDDGLSELCLELKGRLRRSLPKGPKFIEASTQSELSVFPNILENEKIAVVSLEATMQTED